MSEDLITYVLLIVTGIPAAAGTIVAGGRFGGGATLCMMMIGAGVIGLWRCGRRRRELPRAGLRRRPAAPASEPAWTRSMARADGLDAN